jgi:hypothetical protein
LYRYGKVLAIAFGVLAVSSLTDWSWMWLRSTFDFGGSYDFVLSGTAAIGGIAAWSTSVRPMRTPYTVETIVVGSAMLLLAWFVSGSLWFSYPFERGFNLASIAFLIVIVLSAKLFEWLLIQPKETMSRVDDLTLGISIAGVVALLASLFVLPWYSTTIRVPMGQRLDVSLSFSDWRELNNLFSGSVENFTLFYFNSGYWVSILGAVGLLLVVFKGRTKPLPTNPPIRWLSLAAFAVVALSQLFIVIGLDLVDDPDGGVNFGAWLGVAGHSAILYGAFQASRRPKASGPVGGIGYIPIVGAPPPPPSGRPVG